MGLDSEGPKQSTALRAWGQPSGLSRWALCHSPMVCMMPTNATLLPHPRVSAACPGARNMAAPVVFVAFPAGERRRPDLWGYRQELVDPRHLWPHRVHSSGRHGEADADPPARLSTLSGGVLSYLPRGPLRRDLVPAGSYRSGVVL